MASIERLRHAIEHLAALDRASCSPGEHEAAEWIAGAMRDEGADARVEHERVHGTYWWPLGLTSAAGIVGALAARRGRRFLGAALGAAAAATVVDDLGAGRRWLRRLLPKQVAANVVAETGDRDAETTLIVVAHHDAAHTSVFFNPAIGAAIGRALPSTPGEAPKLPPLMLPIAAAPAAVAVAALLRARRLALLSGAVCAGIIASFAEIAARRTVPGANDNLTGVATLLALARSLRESPVEGLRVLLVSTGAEEALMEGMWAFAARHFPALPSDRTYVLCVDSVGSGQLVLAEAEGMLQLREYDPRFNALVTECAEAAGVELLRGVEMRLGTDGYLALRHGLPAAGLMSVNKGGTPSNYHWPTDTPENVDYATLADAVELCDAVVRRLALTSEEDDPRRAQMAGAAAP